MNLSHTELFLRPKKASHLCQLYGKPFERKEALAVWRGSGTILPSIDHRNRPLGNKGGVVDAQGLFVPLSAINTECASYDVGRVTEEKFRAVYCGYFPMHWGHFLTEVVTRLWYALEHDDEVDKYVFTVRPGYEQRMYVNMKAFFRAFGILGKVELVSVPKAYKEVIVPEMCFRQGEYYSNDFVEMFNRVASNLLHEREASQTAVSEKIYLSRSLFVKKGARVEIGTELLDDFFQRNGFKVVHPETVSLSELVAMLHHAKVCASPSGTICHNILFAPSSTSLIIMEREPWLNPYQVNINQLRGCPTTYVDANYGIYPVEMGFGPYFTAFTPWFERFAESRNYSKPNRRFLGEQYLKKAFADYMKTYKVQSGYQWLMKDMEKDADYLYEAYEESEQLFGSYLRREKPYLWHHYMQPHYWRKMLGRFRRRI